MADSKTNEMQEKAEDLAFLRKELAEAEAKEAALDEINHEAQALARKIVREIQLHYSDDTLDLATPLALGPTGMKPGGKSIWKALYRVQQTIEQLGKALGDAQGKCFEAERELEKGSEQANAVGKQ